MSRRLLALDRTVVLLVGLALLALGLAAVDWHYRLVLDVYDDNVRTTLSQDFLATGAGPWAVAVVGALLGLVGLWWSLAHLGRRGPARLRAGASDETGRIEVDLRSLADAAAAQLGRTAPVTAVRGTTRSYGATTVVELRGRVDAAADFTTLAEAVATCVAQVEAAFADDPVVCRVVLDEPRRSRPTRVSGVRVQ